MSHYKVLVVTKSGTEKEVDRLLAPFSENIEVAPYIWKTKEEYERLGWEPSENDLFDADGNLLSTYNPNSKWDWYDIGGRWSGELTLVGDSIGCYDTVPVDRWDIDEDFYTYAVLLPDGSWFAPGLMGWWAMSTETEDEWRNWCGEYVDAMTLLKMLYPNWYVTLVDCHI